jgi:hypothetical protein
MIRGNDKPSQKFCSENTLAHAAFYYSAADVAL